MTGLKNLGERIFSQPGLRGLDLRLKSQYTDRNKPRFLQFLSNNIPLLFGFLVKHDRPNKPRARNFLSDKS